MTQRKKNYSIRKYRDDLDLKKKITKITTEPKEKEKEKWKV